MSNIKNEVITKLRSDIKTKLDQIGAFVDNELADYIMVLVANQKSKYQMKDDLSLFLGAETDQFVNWLHSTLKQIQIDANQSVPNDDKQTKESTKTSDLDSNKVKSKPKRIKYLSKSDKKSVKTEKSETIDKELKENTTNVLTKQISEDINDDTKQPLKDQSNDSIETRDESSDEKEDKSAKLDQNDGEVVLRLNPDGGEVDELLQENDVNEDKKNVKTIPLNDTKVNPIKKAKVIPYRRQPLTTTSTPSSTIGCVVRHTPKVLEDDDEDESKPLVSSMASVVRVTQRKYSIPTELQANKNLLLRAVKDAHESTKRPNEELEYCPTPIKRRLGERPQIDVEVEINEAIEQELDPQDLRNYLNEKDNFEESDDLLNSNRIVKQTQEINPQFVVTLDGVDHHKYMQNSVLEEQLFLNEEMDEELIETEDIEEMDEDLENDDLGANRVNEKCRYWPSCKNGDDCEFAHPSTPCKTFPNCRFGDKCLYIHPNCKFDAMCSRRDCPFTHVSKRVVPTFGTNISSLLPSTAVKQCKYVPNCKNPACPYYHPKICHFGIKCRSHNCPFIHPNQGNSGLPFVTSVPHPHQLKWKARDHISDRQFSAKTDNYSKSTTD